MRTISVDIKDWITKQHSWFTSWQLDKALLITDKRDKTLRRVITKRLCDKGKLTRHPTMNGVFRYLQPAKRIQM